MDQQEVIKALQKIGLTRNESLVYLTLLKQGESKAGFISKKSAINRTTTYDALKSLLDKGLVSYVIKANRKWFRVVNPERLIEIVREEEEEAKKVLPFLKSFYRKPQPDSNVRLFYGYQGIKSVFMDILRNAIINRVMDSEGQFVDRMPGFASYFVKKLEERNIKVKHIVREGRDIKPSKTTIVKFIDKKTKSEAAVNIYSDKIAIIIWSDPPEAVVIQNKSVADSFRYYFDKVWKLS